MGDRGGFPDPPKTDDVLMSSPQGDVKVQRFFWELNDEHYLLARFEYPLALRPGEEAAIYEKSLADLLRSRPGQVRKQEKFKLGPYVGEKLVIAQQLEKSLREVRFVVIGAELYLASAEWPERGGAAVGRAARFLGNVGVRSEFKNAGEVAAAARWRELTVGHFRLRYDATRWYRDPADREGGVLNLLRADQRAEAQFIAEPQAVEGGDIERAVLDTAREAAQSVSVKQRGQKRHGAMEVVELEFVAQMEHVSYVNHGYFYTGREGTVQLRGWAPEQDYPGVKGDITELLEGLTVVPAAD